MYRIYETEAIILKSSPKGETGKSYIMITRDLGVIRATAQAVRVQKSKLRPFLVELKPFTISLVRGKELWRITNAREADIPNLSTESLLAYARISNLVLSLVHGEEKDERLFILMRSLYDDLLNFRSEGTRSVEELYVLRILSLLGYVSKSETLSEFLEYGMPVQSVVDKFSLVRREALQAINTALHATQM
jgi:recombinational DNA repair protein (RecF pathway)